MKNRSGWWLPDYDTHFEKHIVEGSYQKASRDITFEYVKDFNVQAIDVGANVGLWTKPLCEKFTHVHSFEPFDDNRECLQKNVTTNNYTLYDVALGSEQKENQSLYSSNKNCGAGSLDKEWAPIDSGKTTSVVTLDSYNLTNIGYMKVDVQGTEKDVVLGSLETLKNNDVCLVVELPRRNEKELQTHAEIRYILGKIGYHWQPKQFKKEAVFLN